MKFLNTEYQLPTLKDDGLICSTIKSHSIIKHRVLGYCLNIFAKGMKGKWDNRAYIDLFSGPGYARVLRSDVIHPGSPLIALDVKEKFDYYIFCEGNREYFDALDTRIKRLSSPAHIKTIFGDSNQKITEILEAVPKPRRGSTLLSFCLVDPYKIGQLNFQTIKDLSAIFMDFMVLIPSYMDVRRNMGIYLSPNDKSISTFVGDTNWRQEWHECNLKGTKIGYFILNYFGKKMKEIGYLYPGPEDAITIYVDGMGVPLYHLYLFSKNQRGLDFWKKTTSQFTDQLRLI